jgi:hypothetical protein
MTGDVRGNRFLCVLTYLLLSVMTVLTSADGQTVIRSVGQDGKSEYKTYPPGVNVTYVMKGDSILAEYVYDPNKEVSVIVQFTSPPLAQFMDSNKDIPFAKRADVGTSIETDHNRFRTDLANIENKIYLEGNSLLKATASNIRFEYKTVFNGVALTTRQWVVQEIQTLPYVKRIHEDRKVRTMLDESISIIGADSAWVHYGATGKGIIIGIIDTGIDYTHPDLGGGIGPEYKVMGGYDFINDDGDPMDDYGHGTHVAGIAAANGQIKGVAPDAKLMAYKVLDELGSGGWSQVVAGIEQSVIDNVHIINLSLGGPGNPDDPISIAIDNASAAGVVCVVSAGNDGWYHTIGSPGVARSAITVGATDKNDAVAWFSSRGPSNFIYGIKPEVLAPGEYIRSSIMGGGYESFDGTSMSAPHVAGAAALLLENFPDYSPGMIKSILVQSGVDLGYDIWTQGGGRIDLMKAYETELVVEPALLSFGLVDLQQDVWIKEDTVHIHNFSSTDKSVQLSAGAEFPVGADISISPSNFTLSPQQTLEVFISLSVDNNIVPFPKTELSTYTGYILVDSGEEEYSLPVAFIKSPVLQLHFDASWAFVLIHNGRDEDFPFIYFYSDYYLEILLPEDIYDIIILMDDDITTIFVKEDIEVSGLTILTVKNEEAKNRLSVESVDENGNMIVPSFGSFIIDHTESSYWVWSGFGPFKRVRYFSDFSDRYIFGWQTLLKMQNNKKYYLFNNFIQGLDSDFTHTNDPDKFRKIIFDYKVSPDISKIYPSTWSGFGSSAWGWGYSSGEYPKVDEYLQSPEFIQEAYLEPADIPGSSIPLHFNEIYKNLIPWEYNGYLDPEGRGDPVDLLFSTPLLSAEDEVNLNVYSWEFRNMKNLYTHDKENFIVGLGPAYWFGKLSNDKNNIRLTTPRNFRNWINDLFPSQMMDFKWNNWDLSFRLFKDDELIGSGNLFDHFIGFRPIYDFEQDHALYGVQMSVTPGRFLLEIEYDEYYILKRIGKTNARLHFDTNLPDPNPPNIFSLNIFADGDYTDHIQRGQNGEIHVNIQDDGGLANVTMELRHGINTSWIELSVTNDGDIFYVNIPNDLPDGFVSLRITASDVSGNILEYTADPAFRFGDNQPPSAVRLVEPIHRHAVGITDPIEFSWNPSTDPDGDKVFYHITFTGPGVDTTIVNIPDTTLSLEMMPGLRANSRYTWTVHATDGIEVIPTSDIFELHTFPAEGVPGEYTLRQNYPNPFNPVTKIEYELPKTSSVNLTVYNILGQKVATIVDEVQSAGRYIVNFDSSNYASGIYVYRIRAEEFTDAKRMILLR